MAKITLPANELTEFDLPRVCVVTGQSEGVVFKDVKFQWYPRWVVALVLINVLIAAIVAAVLTKKVKGKLPFTEAAYTAWRRGILLQTLSIVGAIVAFIAGAIFMGSDREAVGGFLMVAALVVPIAVYFTQVKGKTVSCTRIADGTLDLTIPSDAAAISIQNHLHAGAAIPAVAMPQG